MSSPPSFRIAVVGGGIGGLFAALCIHHHCTTAAPDRSIKIDVYEQASEYKEIGAGVGVGINAARLVHKLGLGDKLNTIAGHRTGIWIRFCRYDNGENIITLPVNDSQEVRQAPCARSDLLDLLRSAVEDRKAATLHTRKGCVRVEDLTDLTVLHFSDSTTAPADLVIACDGIHSTIRSQIATDAPTYSGQIAYRGVIPTSALPSWPFPSYSAAWLAKHRHFLVFPISQNRELNIVAFITKREAEVADVKESWTTVCEDKTDLERDFEGFEETVQGIIKLMPDRPSRWKINDREPLGTWYYMHGKVVLLGDAAHAMLPHLGAGAGQAMEDGWVLGRAISEHIASSPNPHFATLESTAVLYQRARLPRAQKTQRTSRAAGDTYEFQSEEMEGLDFEDCLPVMRERTKERMKWVWEEDLDECYEGARDGRTTGAQA